MKGHTVLLALTALFSLSVACSSAYVRTPTVSTRVPALSAGVANADVATVQPGIVNTGAGAALSQAPLCAASAICAALDGVQIPLGCVKKVPYTNVLIPRGTTFEVLDKTGDFSCIDTGVVSNGKEVLTCHGKQLYAFQLRLTNAACAGAALPTGTGQCDDGYGYDATAKCCLPVTASEAGSTTVTINLGACPLPSSP